MITKQDLDSAIAECQGDPNPNAQTCLKLAAFYTIDDHLFGTHHEIVDPVPVPVDVGYSAEDRYESESDFGKAIAGKEPSEILPLMDELMQTLSVLHPRLYRSVMRRLE